MNRRPDSLGIWIDHRFDSTNIDGFSREVPTCTTKCTTAVSADARTKKRELGCELPSSVSMPPVGRPARRAALAEHEKTDSLRRASIASPAGS